MTFGSVFGRTFSPTFQPSSQAAVKAGGGTLTVGAAADTWLNSASPGTYNYGGATALGFNTPNVRKSLYRFNLSSIPAAATCVAAKITLTGSSNIYNGRKFLAYEIASANGDWVEGTANGAVETGSPCWNYKAYHASTPTSWAGSVGMSTAGTDYIDTLLAESAGTALSKDNPIDIVFNASGLAVVKSWFGQSTNNGVTIWYNTGASFNMYSKEHATESNRPTLTVTYS